MQLGPIIKFAERALPFVAALGPLAIQIVQARNAAKAGSAPRPQSTDFDASNAPASMDTQVGTKLHGPTGAPIGYGKNGQYLKDALGKMPTKH